MNNDKKWGDTTVKVLKRTERQVLVMWKAGVKLAGEWLHAQSVADEANVLADLQLERAEAAERERDKALDKVKRLQTRVLELGGERCRWHDGDCRDQREDGQCDALEGEGKKGSLGDLGVRDPDFPCDLFDPGPRKLSGDCGGDGHYLCNECSLFEPEPERDDDE